MCIRDRHLVVNKQSERITGTSETLRDLVGGRGRARHRHAPGGRRVASGRQRRHHGGRIAPGRDHGAFTPSLSASRASAGQISKKGGALPHAVQYEQHHMYYSFSFLSGYKTTNPSTTQDDEGAEWNNYLGKVKLSENTTTVLDSLKELANEDAGNPDKSIDIEKKIDKFMFDAKILPIEEYNKKKDAKDPDYERTWRQAGYETVPNFPYLSAVSYTHLTLPTILLV